MDSSSQEGKEKKKVNEIKTFPVPFALEEIQENITTTTNTPSKPSKEQLINQAFKFNSQGNIPEASKYYQYFINQGFKDHRVFSNYGIILNNLGKLQDAEISLRKAIEINPNYAIAHSNLGNILRDIGKLQDAEVSTRKAVELNPDYADAHSNLGSILRDIGKLQDAEVSTRKAIEINPDYAEAHSNLGNILKDLGKLKEAEISLRKAIEIKPDFAMAYFNLGIILSDLGKLQEAFDSYLKAIDINPTLSNIYPLITRFLKDSDLTQLNKSQIKNTLKILLDNKKIPHYDLFNAFNIAYEKELIDYIENRGSAILKKEKVQTFFKDELIINALKKISLKVYSAFKSYQHQKTTLLLTLLLAIGIHTLIALLFFQIAQLMGLEEMELATQFFLMPIGLITVAIPLAPGGIGIGHAAFESLYQLAGFSGGADIFNLFIIVQLGVFLLGGIPYFLYSNKYKIPVEHKELMEEKIKQ